MLTALIGPVTGLLDKFIEDKDQKSKLAHEIATMAEKQAHDVAMAQIEVIRLKQLVHNFLKVRGDRSLVGYVG